MKVYKKFLRRINKANKKACKKAIKKASKKVSKVKIRVNKAKIDKGIHLIRHKK